MAYGDITEELAVEWAQETIGPEQIAKMEASLETSLEELVTPTEVIERSGDLPWDPVPPAEEEEDDEEEEDEFFERETTMIIFRLPSAN